MSKRKDEIHANYDNFIEKVRAGRASAPALKSMYKFGKAARVAEESDMKKEIKQVYKVGNLTLHDEQQAEHYLRILAAAKAYRDAAKAYEDLLAQCECTEDSLVYAQTRYYDSGKQYLDDMCVGKQYLLKNITVVVVEGSGLSQNLTEKNLHGDILVKSMLRLGYFN
ncbi:hypothetical protein AVV29_gp014 [Vibrio phage phi 3]|uniref:Uncharacterized protein n=1 Tax=Vibrio phage phi 3 TaxID=1589298 RepID=A0A0B5H2S2_9CAUD|nr:hypothetical protein AVV29_gp014 [Vibrio phage phi 3]AJF40782.1 hypothetical protein SBVP3_0014 [Vibrio phage phi 3]